MYTFIDIPPSKDLPLYKMADPLSDTQTVFRVDYKSIIGMKYLFYFVLCEVQAVNLLLTLDWYSLLVGYIVHVLFSISQL